MKTISIATIALLLAMQASAMTDTQAAYLKGFQDGLKIMDLWHENATAYNAEAARYNASLAALNESEATPYMLPLASPRIAPVPALFDPDIAIEELHR